MLRNRTTARVIDRPSEIFPTRVNCILHWVRITTEQESNRVGEPNSVAAEVVDGKVLAEEGVADDPKRTDRGGDVHAGKGRDAGTASVQDIVLTLELVLFPVEDKRELGKRGHGVAVDSVLAVPRLLGADSDVSRVQPSDSLLVQHLGNVRRGHDQARSSVNGGTRVLELELFVAKRNSLELDLPVALAPDGHVLDLASVRRVVDTAKHGLASILFRGAETEGEDGLVDQLLVDHIVERRDNVVDTAVSSIANDNSRDGVVAETEDTVKFAKRKGKSGLLGSLCKVLVFDGEVADRDDVTRDEALEGT